MGLTEAGLTSKHYARQDTTVNAAKYLQPKPFL
jgi:hypothetical protein